MKVPADGTKIHEHPPATLWFEDNGILHSISKKVPRTPGNSKEYYESIHHLERGKKVSVLADG